MLPLCSSLLVAHMVKGIKKNTKLGQAPALTRSQWLLWEKFVGERAGARMLAVLAMTGRFGLRTGEALALKREDIDMNCQIPKIKVTGQEKGNKKSPGDVYIRKKDLEWMKHLMKHGLSFNMTKKHKHGKGKKKLITLQGEYIPPKTGFLFTSRKKAKQQNLHYRAVYSVVHKLAPQFLEHLKKTGQKWQADVSNLRPHSGRATLITELMGQGVSTAMSMKFAFRT